MFSAGASRGSMMTSPTRLLAGRVPKCLAEEMPLTTAAGSPDLIALMRAAAVDVEAALAQRRRRPPPPPVYEPSSPKSSGAAPKISS